MAKIFAAQAELNNHPSRNNFDLSHKIHMSGKMGLLYPVYCKPVVPGDSFRIDSGCAFNFMPMPYPTQTRMRFIMHFFYVRNKNLWTNWENWLEGLPANNTGETPVPPYIDQPASFYKTGSLADFLGIPTTYQGMTDVPTTLDFIRFPADGAVAPVILPLTVVDMLGVPSTSIDTVKVVNSPSVLIGDKDRAVMGYVSKLVSTPVSSRFTISSGSPSGRLVIAMDSNGTQLPFKIGQTSFEIYALDVWNYIIPDTDYAAFVAGLERIGGGNYSFTKLGSVYNENIESVASQRPDGGVSNITVNLDSDLVGRINDIPSGSNRYLVVVPISSHNRELGFPYVITEPQSMGYQSYYNGALLGGFALEMPESNMVDISQMPASNPYYSQSNQSEDTVRISALPFRAYESIYNAFYRNTNGNQPFTIDGRIQYNKYNTTTDDGADTTDYQLFHRNWELDAYTSCLPSPQQGAAPVVGISALGEVTIVDPETGVTTTARATDTPNGMQISDVNLGDQTHQQYLINLATSGITINDFRNVNALQRFLETNIRKGYRYMDFIEGHFGVKIKGAILDMPEFIGGFNQSVDVNMISNMTAGKQNGIETLGDYGGQASAFGGSKHSISHFCDDYGFIVGILCLVPEPTYSQILPKHFNVKQPLDYYFPEFSQIGLQPITYEELCPVQSHYQNSIDPTVKLTDVFGYQRPNHDLVWHPDTLHGEFRKSFNKFIINRVYTERPELGNEFLTIKPEETNTIFNYTAPDEDVFLGQVAFNVKAKRPIPRIVIPSLGR